MFTHLKVCSKVLLLACLLLGFVARSTAQDQEWTNEMLQATYMKFLAEGGYLPTIDADGDVQFKREGKTYYIPINAEDTEFFAVNLANIYDVTPENKTAILETCNYVTATTKVAKLQVIDDRKVWITAEIFVSHPEEGIKTFDRMLSSIDTASNKFITKMRELMGLDSKDD
ncbi:MAG: hypothetical protein IPH12_19015 [Saprospirales bacterium]|jgi:hypothetical protein|nr:hypothetical protein [Saprospirales bacterium]MBK8920016.1 hypothetical protein [Saprospirales bacterium]